MTVREYIGARYVPLFIGEWNNENAYEPLSIVEYQGNSYTSRQAVPIGIPITNETYWALTGNYNAQIEQYRQEVIAYNARITANENAIISHNTRITNNEQTISNYNTRFENDETAISNNTSEINSIKERIYNEGKIINVLFPPDENDVPLKADYNSTNDYTDNGVLLQNMLDKYGRNTTFFFPIGNYGFKTPVTINNHYVTFIGSNARATQFFFEPTTISTMFKFEISESVSIEDNLIECISFFNVDVEMDNICLEITNPTRTNIEHIFTFGFKRHIDFNVYINTGSGIIIHNSLCHHWNRTGTFSCIRFNEKTAGAQISDIFIDNCYANCHDVGTWITGVARDIWVTNCDTRQGTFGVYLTAPTGVTTAGGVYIDKTVFDDYAGTAIYLVGFNKEIKITNCWGDTQRQIDTIPTYFYGIILRNTSGALVDGNSWGITDDTLPNTFYHDNFCRLEGNCKDVIISNNIVFTPSIFVQLLSYQNYEPNKVQIINNNIHNNGITALGINNPAITIAAGKNIIISDNIIDANIANTATSTNGVHGTGNLYKQTINAPLSNTENHLLI